MDLQFVPEAWLALTRIWIGYRVEVSGHLKKEQCQWRIKTDKTKDNEMEARNT